MTFQETLTAAVQDLTENGFTDYAQIENWLKKLRIAAERDAGKLSELDKAIRAALKKAYEDCLKPAAIKRTHPDMPKRFDISKLNGQMQEELRKSIDVSASLIRRNRQAAIDKTLQRFEGWASSVPAGGSDAVSRRESKAEIQKSLKQLSYDERRVNIDQSHKLAASINNIIAKGSGAIAVKWRSHWRQPGYNYRPDHKERDMQIYLLRGNWAQEKGLIKPGPAGYYDDITHVGQEVFCRCWAVYIYSPADLPDEMLTVKGKQAYE